MENKPVFDKLDLAIARELEKDGRVTASDLARRLGISRATVHRRMQRILSEGMVTVVGVTDPGVLGYKVMASIGINVTPGQATSVADALAAFKNVHTVLVCTGRYDIIAWVILKEAEDLHDFLVRQLGNIPGVARTETMVNLAIRKRSFTYLGDAVEADTGRRKSKSNSNS